MHHADYTCLAQAIAFTAEHRQIERYCYPFKTAPGADEKTSVRSAINAAMEARRKRDIRIGRMHVEIDLDNPGCGRVVDHLPRDAGKNIRIPVAEPVAQEPINDIPPESTEPAPTEEVVNV